MRILKNNLSIKLAALFVAIFAWYYVMEDKNPIRSLDFRNLSVQMVNAEQLSDENLVLMDPKNPVINITVKGKRNVINRLEKSDIQASIDLQEHLEEGRHEFTIKIDKPNDVDIAKMDKTELIVTMENVIEKSMPVHIKIMDTPSDDFVLGEVSSTPSSILVEGPSSQIAKLDQVVAPIFVEDLKDNSTQNVPFELIDVDGRDIQGLNVKQEFVSVNIEVNQVKEVPVKLSTQGQPPEDIHILNSNISPKTVSVIGNREILQDLSEIDIIPVDLSSIKGDTQVKLTLKLPDGVELLNKKQSIYCNFSVDKDTEKTILIPPSSVEVKNLKTGLQAEFSDKDFIQVKVSGKKSVVDNWTSKNIHLVIDVADLEAGSHDVKLEADPIDGAEILEIKPTSLVVTLK